MSDTPIAYDGTDDALGNPLGTVYNLQFEGGRVYHDFVSEYSYRRLQSELTAAQKDAERLEWLEQKLFMSAWNGVLDSGSNRDWRIHSGYRHVTARMQGGTFRNAIDAAIAAKKQQ